MSVKYISHHLSFMSVMSVESTLVWATAVCMVCFMSILSSVPVSLSNYCLFYPSSHFDLSYVFVFSLFCRKYALLIETKKNLICITRIFFNIFFHPFFEPVSPKAMHTEAQLGSSMDGRQRVFVCMGNLQGGIWTSSMFLCLWKVDSIWLQNFTSTCKRLRLLDKG